MSYRTTEQQLAQTFSEVGEVRSIFIGTDRETGRSRGFAFVEFGNAQEAEHAIRRFDGQEIDGRKVRVNAAEERAARSTQGRSGEHAPWAGLGRGDTFRPDARSFKSKGSRRNLRARKRSLNF